MTVCLAYRVPGEGCVLVSDGRVTDGALRVLTDSCDKSAVLGSCVALVAGCDGRALQDLQELKVKKYADILAYVRSRHGESEDYWQLIVWDRSGQKLYTLDSALTELEHSVAAIGCGSDIATGVLSALPHPQSLEEATRALNKAARVACRRNAGCGGRIRTIVVRGKRKPIERM